MTVHAFLSWFAGHVAGPLVTGTLVGGVHLILSRRHVKKVTEAQTQAIREITDAQTRTLTGGDGKP